MSDRTGLAAAHAAAAGALETKPGLGVMDAKGYGYWDGMRPEHVAEAVAVLRSLGWQIEEPGETTADAELRNARILLWLLAAKAGGTLTLSGMDAARLGPPGTLEISQGYQNDCIIRAVGMRPRRFPVREWRIDRDRNGGVATLPVMPEGSKALMGSRDWILPTGERVTPVREDAEVRAPIEAPAKPLCRTCGLPLRGLACQERWGTTRMGCPQL